MALDSRPPFLPGMFGYTKAAKPEIGLVRLAALAMLFITGCTAESDQASDAIVVVDVVDGDTVKIAIGENIERVRLLGIDAPESVHPSVPVQCFGAEASETLRRLLPADTKLEIYRDKQLRDHYGRLLLYVYRADDGLDVNRYLVEQGLAATAFYEPNYYLRSELSAAERKAKANHVGLWGTCDGPDQPLQ